VTNQRKKSGGALFFETNKRSEDSPDFSGEIEILKEEAMHIVEALKAGRDPKLRIAGWKKVSAKGNKFIGLGIEIPRNNKTEKSDDWGPDPKDDWGDKNDLDDQIPF